MLLGLLAWTALGLAAVALPVAGPRATDPLQVVPEFQLAAALRLSGWCALNWSLLFVLLALLIVPHELGHVLGAWLVGLRVFSVQIGQGRLLGSVRFLGAHWQLRAFLDFGVTYTGYPNLRFLRWKFFIMVLGGPLMNAVLLAAALWWRPPAALWGEVHHWLEAPGLLPLPVFVVASVLLLLLISLVPSRARVAGAVHTSDGLKLLLAPFVSRAEREGSHALYFALEGGACLSERRCLDALRWYERGLERYPQSGINAFGACCALIVLRRYDEAEQRLAELRGRKDMGPGLEALMADASATAVLGRVIEGRCRPPDGAGAPEGDTSARLAALLEEGERWSQEALNAGSKLPLQTQWSLMGTYGCLLIEQGRLDEGAAILRLARAEVEPSSDRAYCLSYLAVVAARQGRPEEARAALQKARRLVPGHIAVERAEWELAQGA